MHRQTEAARLGRDLGAIVVSAGYRLAPEHPFPAATDDTYAALCWAAETFDGPVVVMGESAGANLAAEKPELTAEISRRRVERAAALEGVNTLVSACPWSERPLSEQGKEQGIEVFDIFELVAEAAGFEV